MKAISLLITLWVCLYSFVTCSQVLPLNRSTDWTIAGLRDTTTAGFQLIDMQSEGVIGDGVTPNDSIVSDVLASLSGNGSILNFPTGNFLFHQTINLPSNTIIRGMGPAATTFVLDLGGSGHGIVVTGQAVNSDTSSVIQPVIKDSFAIQVANSSLWSAGDWIQLIQEDTLLVTSAWAIHTAGQIIQVASVINNTLYLNSPLRISIGLLQKPFIRKLIPVKNVGIECLKLIRMDNTLPEQSSNVFFSRAVNSRVSGIESQSCNFSHIEAEFSSNLSIVRSYIHHAFDYGEGGRAYGVILHFTTNECRVEDNIFEHLRHSMLVQAGSNGNVFAYNYSFDPYWASFPNNSAGEIVLHGNFPFLNLFEQNICQNMVIDNSHGANGPYNTFFRNRAGGYGIFFSASNSPDQNFIGNEIPNTGFPYSLVNYTILGSGHFLYGNNNKGTIVPAGTQILADSSYAYNTRPWFIPLNFFAAMGTPNIMGAGGIPARERYLAANLFYNSCGIGAVGFDENQQEEEIRFGPNPFSGNLYIEMSGQASRLIITNNLGKEIQLINKPELSLTINTVFWPAGIYFTIFTFDQKKQVVKKIIKIR